MKTAQILSLMNRRLRMAKEGGEYFVPNDYRREKLQMSLLC